VRLWAPPGHACLRFLSVLLTVLGVSALVAAAAARGSALAARAAPAPVVVTTDCGVEIDDQWVLAHIALSPELELRGVVTTHASTIGFSSATSARTAAEVLSRVVPSKAPSVRVVAGSDVPLPDVDSPRGGDGSLALLNASRGFSRRHRLIVLSTGAATDVASAILRDPSVADRIEVIAMGFDDWPSGGREFNITNDPNAWRVILGSPVPLVVGSSTVTKRTLRLTRADAAALMNPHGSIGEYLYGLFDAWLTKNSELADRMVGPGAWVIWDEVVVAYALGLAHGEAVARPALQPDLFFSHPDTARRITWISQIDTDQVWRDFTRKIDAADRARTSRGH